MEELIEKLKNIHGLSADQSMGILDTIKEFVKEKCPMVGGAIDNIFPLGTTAAFTAPSNAQSAKTPVHDGVNFLDKISDFIPSAMGQKIEDLAKIN